MKKTLLPLVLGILTSVLTPARAERMSVLDDGTIRIGVDLDLGGTITLLSRSKDGPNLINSHDLGRQVQQSYYSGPHPFGRPHPGWKNWPWNPIGSGDVYNHHSRVVEHANDGKTLYTKIIPMQWALDNVPGECTFETWITLKDNAAHIRCRLDNHRPDRTQYPAQNQELPAVYTIGTLHRLFTYDGDKPFENGPLRQVHNDGPPWTDWKATENWAALVDDRGFGVGVIHPGVYAFIGGFHGKPNTGGPKDDPTGYIAPTRLEILDHNIVYEYSYILAVGTLAEIRAVAAENRIRDARPDDRFAQDRRHWTYIGATDAGFPIDGKLRVRPGRSDPQMIGPERRWEASTMPKLHIRATYRRPAHADVFWRAVGDPGFSADRRAGFDAIPDGRPHTYEVDLSASPAYRGIIAGLRFDPTSAGTDGEEIDIAFISWKPE